MSHKTGTLLNTILVQPIADRICKSIGHRWRYKDYSNFIKATGEKYDFKASRNCTRCGQHSYYYAEWQNEKKSKLDFESSNYALKKIKINRIVYS